MGNNYKLLIFVVILLNLLFVDVMAQSPMDSFPPPFPPSEGGPEAPGGPVEAAEEPAPAPSSTIGGISTQPAPTSVQPTTTTAPASTTDTSTQTPQGTITITGEVRQNILSGVRICGIIYTCGEQDGICPDEFFPLDSRCFIPDSDCGYHPSCVLLDDTCVPNELCAGRVDPDCIPRASISLICNNNIQDNTETGVDCGSNDCPACGGSATCGNGQLERLEQCDDGNSINGDGCSSNCLVEEIQPGCANVGGTCKSGSCSLYNDCSSTPGSCLVGTCCSNVCNTPSQSLPPPAIGIGIGCTDGAEITSMCSCGNSVASSGFCCNNQQQVLSCSACSFTGAETCDGQDNDCDGTTDEGNLCGANNACISGTCQPREACGRTNGGVECCGDSIDNDCSGGIDDICDRDRDNYVDCNAPICPGLLNVITCKEVEERRPTIGVCGAICGRSTRLCNLFSRLDLC